jgi:hypothetical protein
MTKNEIAQAVYNHALKNYRHDGWDIIVECYDLAEIVEVMGNASTVVGAIKNVQRIIKPAAAYRKEVEATAY